MTRDALQRLQRVPDREYLVAQYIAYLQVMESLQTLLLLASDTHRLEETGDQSAALSIRKFPHRVYTALLAFEGLCQVGTKIKRFELVRCCPRIRNAFNARPSDSETIG